MTPPRLFAGGRRRLLGWIIVSTLAQAVALAAAAIATRAVFVALHAGEGLPLIPILLVGSAGICATLTQLSFRNLAEYLGQDYAKDIRLALYDHASRSNQNDLNQRRMGYQVLRFTGDLTALKDWPGLGLPHLVQAAILLPSATAVLIYLDSGFIEAAACAVFPATLWAVISHHKLLRAHTTLRQRRAQLAANITERLPIAPKLSALGRRQTERRALETCAIRVMDAARHRRAVSEMRKAIPEFSAALAASLIMIIGSFNNLQAGTIAAALAALALTIRPLRNVMSSSDRAAGFQAAHSKLKRALERPLATPGPRKKRLHKQPPAIEIISQFGHVLKLDAGEVATLSHDLMDLAETALSTGYSPEDYTFKLNGYNVADLTPGSLRRSVGVLTNAPLILKGSLRRALTLGLRPRPSDDAIFNAAERAGLPDLIPDVGDLNSKLAERGANLDASQRLAISLLRLVLQEPGVIVVRCPAPRGVNDTSWASATKLVQAPAATMV